MDKTLLEIVMAVLFDTIEILQIMNKSVKEQKAEIVTGINLEAFGSRLRWLADKFKDIERSSVAIDVEEVHLTDQKSIDELLAGLGL
jgi:hypothetical protein